MSTDMSTAQELYQDKGYCYQEIEEAHRVMANPQHLTNAVARQLGLGLGIMLLYCPEDVVVLVQFTLDDLAKIQVTLQ